MKSRVALLAVMAFVAACTQEPTSPPATSSPQGPTPSFDVRGSSSDIVIDNFSAGSGAWAACGNAVFALQEDASIAGGAREVTLRDRGSCHFGWNTWARVSIDAVSHTVRWYGYHTYFPQQVLSYGTAIGRVDRSFLGTGYNGNDDPYQGKGQPLHLSLTTHDEIVINAQAVSDPYISVRVVDRNGYASYSANWVIHPGLNVIPLSSLSYMRPDVAAEIDGITVSGGARDPGDVFTEIGIHRVPTDTTPPDITPNITGTLGNNGWYVSDVGLTWSVSDAQSPVSSETGCDAASVTSDTQGQSFTCSATSAGGTASKTATIKRDVTPPSIAFSGNAGTYTVDQTVAISCTAADATSGIATGCANDGVSGDAYTFGVGTQTVNASAQDNAGNTATASTTFNVIVTATSLCTLTERWVSQAGVAHSMCQQLANGAYGAYANHVSAQSGKTVSASNAATLIALAGDLGAPATGNGHGR